MSDVKNGAGTQQDTFYAKRKAHRPYYEFENSQESRDKSQKTRVKRPDSRIKSGEMRV